MKKIPFFIAVFFSACMFVPAVSGANTDNRLEPKEVREEKSEFWNMLKSDSAAKEELIRAREERKDLERLSERKRMEWVLENSVKHPVLAEKAFDFVISHPKASGWFWKHPMLIEWIVKHPFAAKILEKHEEVAFYFIKHARAEEFLGKHPEFAKFLIKHPRVAEYMKKHPKLMRFYN